MKNYIFNIGEALDKIKRQTRNGVEVWSARQLQRALNYENWQNFKNVIERAYISCESAGINPDYHFIEISKLVAVGSGANRKIRNYILTRYACYLIAMNGDTGKSEIAEAQAYFAIQTRRQEINDEKSSIERRIELRKKVIEANKNLCSAASRSGVKNFPIFQNAGYEGLYTMSLNKLKKYKRIGKDDLLDRAGRTELAANMFRITQTEEKLLRDKVEMENDAIITHRHVGMEVRSTIKKIGGIMPEDLSPEEPIKKLLNKRKKEFGPTK